MVREENVKAIRCSMANIVATKNPKAILALSNLIHCSRGYRNLFLNPMRDNIGTSEGTFYDGGFYAQDVESGIESLHNLNVDLPRMPVEDFCETLEQALDDPHY